MEPSKIEWTDYTWNPITGCRNDCAYCYAAKMAKRFCGDIRRNKSTADYEERDGIYILHQDIMARNGRTLSFPFGFEPTLHEHRLGKNCKPAKIPNKFNFFVGSVADLWGDWIPDEWIRRVLDVCVTEERHNYLFLTKNPERYIQFQDEKALPNAENLWYGATVTNAEQMQTALHLGDLDCARHAYMSFEPLHEDITKSDAWAEFAAADGWIDWAIIGAETGQRRDKIIPKKEWIENLVAECREYDIPVFLKNNLSEIWGGELIQELPTELQKKAKKGGKKDACKHSN